MARRMLWLSLVVAIALVAFWAGREATVTPSDPLIESRPVAYEIIEGTVGRSFRFTARAEWLLSPVGRNSGVGTVTSVGITGVADVEPGEVLYSIDLRPVVAAEGPIPMFRALAARSEGPDVAQVQSLLDTLGFYDGTTDGVYGPAMQRSVKAWQESLGVEADGVVRRGDVVFFPELPSRLILSEDIEVGAPLMGGERAVLALSAAPKFTVTLGLDQRDLVPLAADATVEHSEGIWTAKVASATETPFGELELELTGLNGEQLCRDECELVPVGDVSLYETEIVVTPPQTGPVVPIAAIVTDPAGRSFVTELDGETREVVVLAAASGLAVVSGVEAGDVLILPFGGSS
ncbi:MAG: peptidoglycan-binding protein [Acidimicrobiia bacterium]|nr:peptidoglycan-binding protein [Acidimicrobiia bacterium]NNF08950.1 peptidoglycan-binding protein [Acidimicrobiia bacterium]NNL71342.1 peptidoglycan-binding protein [Acidimicrobiia bacterium]